MHVAQLLCCKNTQFLLKQRLKGAGLTWGRSLCSSSQAYFETGLRHFKRSVNEKGKTEALDQARRAWHSGAQQGHVNCQNALGGLYLKEKDFDNARRYFKLAADKGHARAATELGKLCWERLRSQETRAEDKAACSAQMVQYFSIGARANHTEACWGLSLCYDYGYGVDQCYNRARELLHTAANGNHPEALFRLGDHYRLGLGGIDCNPERALHFYGSAADLGFCAAQFNYGLMHLLGKGVPINEDTGTKYLFLAGQQGHIGALYILGDLLYHGKAGLPQKRDEAEQYFQQAALGGNTEAAEALIRYGLQPITR